MIRIRKRNGFKIVCIILALIVAFFAVINLIPPRKVVEENPFIVEEGALPMIAAHRGGAINNPENTLLAFREAVAMGVDILESDLYLTKDGYLVYSHDSYIDENSDANGDITLDEVETLCDDRTKRHYIRDMTLEELQSYNFGYYFEDENGERIYKDETDLVGMGLQIATADQLFEEFYESHPDLLFIVEIKNSGEDGIEACRILNETLEKYPVYQDNIVIGTFNPEVEEELAENYPHLMRGASTSSAAKFIITQLLGVNLFDNSSFSCLQIPIAFDLEDLPLPFEIEDLALPLDNSGLIRRAHRRNMAVQYWTINDPDEMRRLIELGADAIMTDDPALLKEILEEYK